MLIYNTKVDAMNKPDGHASTTDQKRAVSQEVLQQRRGPAAVWNATTAAAGVRMIWGLQLQTGCIAVPLESFPAGGLRLDIRSPQIVGEVLDRTSDSPSPRSRGACRVSARRVEAIEVEEHPKWIAAAVGA